MSNQTQIALDFGQEPQAPPSTPAPAPAVSDGEGEAPVRPFMTAGGVGVRIKAYKQAPTPQNGELFGSPPPEEIAAAPAGPAPETPAAPEAPVEHVEAPVIALTEPKPAPATKRGPATKRPAAAKQGPSKRGRKSLKQVAAEADLIEIPEDEVLFSKQYYTMGEVSEMFHVNQSLLRFWETEFDILQPRKNKKGDRYFRPIDIKHLHLIYHLLRQKKYTIEGAKDFLKNNKKAEERFEIIQRLQQIKDFLQEMKAQL
jgi:DNA-binding transcriptional MerR regulator